MESPNSWEARGSELYRQREFGAAIECYSQALRMGGDWQPHAGERWMCWMLLGQWCNAWAESDRSGTSLKGEHPFQAKRVLIRCQRGLGDAIQFLRYARLLGEQREILVEAPQGLLPLLSLLPGITATHPLVFPTGISCASELECSDLPYLFRTTPHSVPFANGYVSPPTGSADIPARAGKLRVGIAWAGAAWNASRSIPIQLLRGLRRLPHVQWVSLQRDAECAATLSEVLDADVLDAERGQSSIVRTAAVIAGLDLVISVDTMIAHLAGAMGKKVWILLPYDSDWRWMLAREDSPWYATMRLFRQKSRGDWTGSIHQLRLQLANAA